MMKKLKFLAAAGAVALMPAMASAVTYTTSGITGSYECNAQGGFPAGQIDVLAGASFTATFDNGDSGGALCFDLVNNSGSVAAVTLAAATVDQLGEFSYFTGGVSLITNSGTLATVAQGDDWSENFQFVIGVGQTIWFDFGFGDVVVASDNLSPSIDFQVFATPVPVPAAGFLLVGALGGLGLMRRRRKAS